MNNYSEVTQNLSVRDDVDDNEFWKDRKERIDGWYVTGRYCCILIAISRKVAPAFGTLKSGTTNLKEILSGGTKRLGAGGEKIGMMS